MSDDRTAREIAAGCPHIYSVKAGSNGVDGVACHVCIAAAIAGLRAERDAFKRKAFIAEESLSTRTEFLREQLAKMTASRDSADYADRVHAEGEQNALARERALRSEIAWLCEFVQEPEWFPSGGDRQYWRERFHAAQQIVAPASAERRAEPPPE